MKKCQLKISVFELVAYILSGLMGLWGVTYMILGICCEFLKYDSALVVADKHLRETTGNMGFLGQGLLVLGIALVVAVIVLLVNAKKSDKVFEKNQRRAARMQTQRTFGEQPSVSDAEVSEVSAQK